MLQRFNWRLLLILIDTGFVAAPAMYAPAGDIPIGGPLPALGAGQRGNDPNSFHVLVYDRK